MEWNQNRVHDKQLEVTYHEKVLVLSKNEAKAKLLKYDGIWQSRNECDCMCKHTHMRMNVLRSTGLSQVEGVTSVVWLQ
jgi:hypothetical protein